MENVVIQTVDKTADILFDISEKMLRRENPFDNLIINDSIASPVFLNFLKYANEIDQNQKEKLLEYLIVSSRHLMKGRLFGRQPIFAKKYPELMKTADQFMKWYFAKQERPSRNISINMHNIRKLNIRQRIKDEVEKNHPEYFLEKDAKKHGTARFSKRITDSVLFVVYFEIGIKRTFFNVEFGLNNPSFLIDIGNLLARPQSMFSYENAENIKNGIRAAFDFINSIDPKVFVRSGI